MVFDSPHSGQQEINFPVEDIPDEDFLYMRIHKEWVKNGFNIAVFKNRGNGMSTDWCKYSTAEKTRNCAKHPLDNGVIKMNVGDVRKIEGQSVEHTPSSEPKNQAHTDVKGEKTEEVRVLFSRIYKWEIYIGG